MATKSKTFCPRCCGSGWVCEVHRRQPMNHPVKNARACGGAGSPCEEPGCPFRTHPTDADVAASDPE
jgi:hypothetical protein